MSQPQASNTPSRPWWRESMMWLVIGGPSVVVVASFVTLALAITYPDPVIEAVPAQASAGSEAAMSSAQTPAMKARNHAATGGR
ncbi:hypothetical protein [Paucibacter sp. XJ19-41]|uniref:hypothetical protein n=1 Tax=Paucibacter sp. XJ19-41 TaxID=2927824 RepID=UPI00234A8788|nr:hypothetical protein [Paucibacter sp. XJ19-41]MDC6171010.1 hypothetical protein [Paucibacter sp. XJ19-41]